MPADRPLWVDRVISGHILSIPPYSPGKPIAELERELGVINAVKMASNENPLGPSPMAIRALEELARGSHVYPEDSAPELRAALASRYNLPKDAVILGNGSDEVLQFAAHVFIRPGDEAVIAANTFSVYQMVVKAFGGKVRSVPLVNYCYDLKAMAAAVNQSTRLVFIAVPNSPTGTIVSRKDFESFFNDLPEEGLLLILDEAYREYVREPDCPNGVDYIGRGRPVLVSRTFSKIYGLAGLRIGYGLSEPWAIELMNRVRPPFNANSLAQAAALAALNDFEHVERSVHNTEEGMKFLQEELNALGLEVVPSQANFCCFCLGREARPLYEALLRQGVIVRHLASFGMERCMRVTIGTQAENRRFIEALKRALAATEDTPQQP
jgi:histidinol-phosphate aminotransferase